LKIEEGAIANFQFSIRNFPFPLSVSLEEGFRMIALAQAADEPPRKHGSINLLAWEWGDIVAFSGRGAVSRGIRLGTCSAISHVGIVAWTPKWQLENLVCARALRMPEETLETWRDQDLLYESTTLCGLPCAIRGKTIHGVQAHPPEERLAEYDGRAWRYRLAPEWWEDVTEEREDRLVGHLLARIGQRYDRRGAVLAGTHLVKHLWPWAKRDRASVFCSEYLASVLQHVGLLPISNAGKITPAGLIRQLVEAEVYLPGEELKTGN
jgi:hypothetical protein